MKALILLVFISLIGCGGFQHIEYNLTITGDDNEVAPVEALMEGTADNRPNTNASLQGF